MGDESCHAGHRDRIRQRFIRFGADSLFDHELLELVLFYAMPRRNTNEIAHDLIVKFGDLKGVLNAPPEELKQVKGIGDAAAAFIGFMRQVSEEYGSAVPVRGMTASYENISEYFRDHFTGAAENLCIVHCPANNTKLMFFKDKLLASDEEVRGIVESLVLRQCSSVVIGINHGAGPLTPDSADFDVVKLFSEKLSPLDITVSDCIIVNSKNTFSLKYSSAI
ncbi:MAG: RadC family protein [Ruminococcus sp.]|nr:RadC family protein [Ruminococcus sp.]